MATLEEEGGRGNELTSGLNSPLTFIKFINILFYHIPSLEIKRGEESF